MSEESEFRIVLNTVKSSEHLHPEVYFIGLDIAVDNSSRVFSNGELFDYKVHGSWHYEHFDLDTVDCPEAHLNSLMDVIYVNSNGGCGRTWGPYICFQAKEHTISTAKALTVQEGSDFYFVLAGIFFGAFVCSISAFIISNNRYKKLKESLDLK